MNIFDALKNKIHIETIKKKLKTLESLDKGHCIFGSEFHKYKMNFTLSDEQIRKFEIQHLISIPVEYRAFLLSIGDGGTGPFYGLYQLDENSNMVLDIAKPFEFTCKRSFNMMVKYEQIPDDISDDEQDKILDEIYNKANKGFILLATEGCGMYSILVVNGEEYGHVWFHDLANDAGIFPLVSPISGNPMRFLEWYEIWLDKSIEYLKTGSEKFSSYADFISPS